ncbi:aspartyl protease family protein [Chitinophaga filiformis]|uniref:Aspartyl protease n=1 Tax=Chitinophaga filiformis TaxID=104663 RepID=A0A1G8ANU3_CHIFI|nr:aspartyl protease family protein [Chitinophaga filiformis]SDH21950.1 Aspartyl protease [Chitinophaga filiformis]
MKRMHILFGGLLILTVPAFSQIPKVKLESIRNNVSVKRSEIKTSIPFELVDGNIIINTYWGKEGQPVKLKLDNGANTVVDSLTKITLKDIRETNTPDKARHTPNGQTIMSHYLVTDNVRVGDLNFKNVPFLPVPHQEGPEQGLMGINMLKKGIWKIDFEHKQISFATTIDSIEGVKDAKPFPAKFNRDGDIKVEIEIDHSQKELVSVDLGYNGDLVLPPASFTPVIKDKYVYKATGTSSTIAGVVDTRFYLYEHAVFSFNGDTYLDYEVSTSDIVKDKLLGAGFFSDFKFVIFDFVNRNMYVSKGLIPRKVKRIRKWSL